MGDILQRAGITRTGATVQGRRTPRPQLSVCWLLNDRSLEWQAEPAERSNSVLSGPTSLAACCGMNQWPFIPQCGNCFVLAGVRPVPGFVLIEDGSELRRAMADMIQGIPAKNATSCVDRADAGNQAVARLC